MDRVFLDANVLFSAARSTTSRLRKLWDLIDTQLLSSAFAIDEARRNLALDRPEALTDLDVLIARVAIVPQPPPRALPVEMSLPEKDWPIFLAAMEGQATYLVTGDKKHFGPYRGQTIADITILTPSDYLATRGV